MKNCSPAGKRTRATGKTQTTSLLTAILVTTVLAGGAMAAPNIAPIVFLLLNKITLADLPPAHFEDFVEYPVHDYAYLGRFVDVDGDNILDILVGGVGEPDTIPSDNLTFIPGNEAGTTGVGDGTFAIASKVVTQTGAYKSRGFTVADFDGDGNVDVATASPGEALAPPQVGQTINILYGNGDGSFDVGGMLVYDDLPNVRGLVAADVDQDGDLDIVFTVYVNQLFNGAIAVLENSYTVTTPRAGFVAPAAATLQDFNNLPSSGRDAKYHSGGDFDGDGWVDFAVPSATEEIFVHFNNQDGSLADGLSLAVPSASEFTHIADINGDTNLDILVSHQSLSTDTTNDDPGGGPPTYEFIGGFSVLTGNGDGTFDPAVPYLGLGNGRNITTGDFNGDGHVDIIIGLNDVGLERLTIMLNTGEGAFLEANSLDSFLMTGIDVADTNGDGRPDVLDTISATLDAAKVHVHLGAP